MQNATETGSKVTEYLLQIKAVKLAPQDPFSWASGWKSPIYCDNRLTLSYPEVRDYIRDCFVQLVKQKYAEVDIIAGVATGGIALGALVAQELNLPFCYVRSSSKGHGLQNQIEGHLPKGSKVVVLEDLISTGGSSLKAVDALRAREAQVLGMLGIFTYGFQRAAGAFSAAKVDLDTLSNYDILINQAIESGLVGESDRNTLTEWKQDPESWGSSLKV